MSNSHLPTASPSPEQDSSRSSASLSAPSEHRAGLWFLILGGLGGGGLLWWWLADLRLRKANPSPGVKVRRWRGALAAGAAGTLLATLISFVQFAPAVVASASNAEVDPTVAVFISIGVYVAFMLLAPVYAWMVSLPALGFGYATARIRYEDPTASAVVLALLCLLAVVLGALAAHLVSVDTAAVLAT